MRKYSRQIDAVLSHLTAKLRLKTAGGAAQWTGRLRRTVVGKQNFVSKL